jgi:hypothetical protein
MQARDLNMRTMVAATFGALWIAGCGGGGEADSVAGPCIIQTMGPSLTIASVTSATTGAAIPVITLSDVSVGGMAVPALPTGDWVNVKAAGSNLECTVACGFSSAEGATTLTVSAPGYASKAISATSGYATRVGGCPGSYSNGAQISISLSPLS